MAGMDEREFLEAQMGTNWFHLRGAPGERLQELAPGKTVFINGERRRVRAVKYELATEPDPELGIEIGDWVYSVEFEEAVK